MGSIRETALCHNENAVSLSNETLWQELNRGEMHHSSASGIEETIGGETNCNPTKTSPISGIRIEIMLAFNAHFIQTNANVRLIGQRAPLKAAEIERDGCE